MFKFIVWLLTIAPVLATGQIHCIKTDLFGIAYPYTAESSMRSVYGFKASVGYEYLMNSRYSLGATISYGYSPLLANISWNGSPGTAPINDVTVTKGMFLYIEGRRYFGQDFESESTRTLKGFYVGLFAGVLRGEEIRYVRLGLFGDDPLFKASEALIWTYGFGPMLGYKFNLGERILIEPQLGMAIAKTSPALTVKETDYRFLHLTRLELNIGYLISGN